MEEEILREILEKLNQFVLMESLKSEYSSTDLYDIESKLDDVKGELSEIKDLLREFLSQSE